MERRKREKTLIVCIRSLNHGTGHQIFLAFFRASMYFSD